MGARQEFFKEELAGSIQRRIFKAKLMGAPMVVSPRMKLIVPLVKFTHVHDLLNKIHAFDTFEWSHNRGQNGTLEYAGYPVAERITDQAFYLWDDWQIYYAQRHLITNMGWVEMNKKHEIEYTFNYFVPLGLYDKSDRVVITRKDGTEKIYQLPEYDEKGVGSNGFHVETTNAKRVEYYFTNPDGTIIKQNLANSLGIPVEKLALQGNCVKFPTKYR